uniref:Uncharacterized protein n=1 Tax=Acrobeloides nanus TaxID=290746 RepID=A0A914ECA3_9BILA
MPPIAKPMPPRAKISKEEDVSQLKLRSSIFTTTVPTKKNISHHRNVTTTDWLLSKMLYHWNKNSPRLMVLNLCKKAAIAMHYRWHDKAANLLKNCGKLINKRRKQLRQQVAGDFYEQKLTVLRRKNRSISNQPSKESQISKNLFEDFNPAPY